MAGGLKSTGWLSVTGQVLTLDLDMGYLGSLIYPKVHTDFI